MQNNFQFDDNESQNISAEVSLDTSIYSNKAPREFQMNTNDSIVLDDLNLDDY